MRRAVCSLCLIALATGPVAGGQTKEVAAWPPLKDGDCIVFFGDSITEHGQRPGGYVTLVEQALRQRLPDRRIRVVGAGKGWDKVADLRERIDRDVLKHKPTIVVIEIGINDVCEENSHRSMMKKIWRMGLEDVIWRVKRAGARPVLTTLTVVGEKTDAPGKYDVLLEAYSGMIRDIAADRDCQLVELRNPFLDYIRANNKDNTYEGVLTTDGAHLNDRGNELMSDLILEAFGVPAGEPE